jgi:hypothetical protein
MFGWVVIDSKEAMFHLHGNIVIFLDCYGLLLLHLAARQGLFGWLTLPHEKLVHLFLFFSSILHGLQVARESRRSP